MRSTVCVAAFVLLTFTASSDAFFGCNGAAGSCDGGVNPYAGFGDYSDCQFASRLWNDFCHGYQAPPRQHCNLREVIGGGCGCGLAGRFGGGCATANGWYGLGGSAGCSAGGCGLGRLRGLSALGCGSCGAGFGSSCAPVGGCSQPCGPSGLGHGFGGCGGGMGGGCGLFARLRSHLACRSWVGGGPLDSCGLTGGFSNTSFDYGSINSWAAAAPVHYVQGSAAAYQPVEAAPAAYAPQSDCCGGEAAVDVENSEVEAPRDSEFEMDEAPLFESSSPLDDSLEK